MEAAGFSITSVTIYKATWCHNPEVCNQHFHGCENLKSIFTFPCTFQLELQVDRPARSVSLAI
jgi:hypothetical protein